MKNQHSLFVCNGASSHSAQARELNDFYATEPKAMELLLENERFKPSIWECACGQGHLSKVLLANGYKVLSTDLVNRGYGISGVNFLTVPKGKLNLTDTDIITNPPYSLAQDFVEHALDLLPDGGKVAMFLKLTFMEGKARKPLFVAAPPFRIYVSSSRLKCAKNGDFTIYDKGASSAVAYGWYVWIKGFTGTTTIKWIN